MAKDKRQVSLAKSKAAAVVLAFLLIAVMAVVALNASSEKANAASLGVGIVISPVRIEERAPVQNMTPWVNGTNISVALPLFFYNTTGVANVTIDLPSSWRKITNVKVNESGVIKNVTVVGSQLTWEANRSATNITLVFDAAPPSLDKVDKFLNTTFTQTNLTIDSDNSFINASASVEVNASYSFYTLYWYNSSHYVDKTVEFNLRVASGTATWDSFNTSTVLFMLEGSNSCTESWSCSGWSKTPDCGTRTCTDANHCGTTVSKPVESAACLLTPGPITQSGGGGGGGGGQIVSKEAAAGGVGQQQLHVDKEQIRARVMPGELKKEFFTITNAGREKLSLKIQISGVSNIVSLDTSYVELEPGASHTVGLLIVAEKSAVQGVHTGIITISYGGVEKRVSVIVEVEPPKSLFDIIVTVNPSTKTVLAGNTVIADISLFNLVGSGKFDVTVRYGIINYNDKLVIEKQQTVAVETRAGIIGTMDVPRDSKPGTYSFFAAAEINGAAIGLGSDTFEVINPVEFSLKEGISASNVMFVLVVALLVITLALIIFSAAEFIAHHFPHSHIGREMGAERAIARQATKAAAEGAIPDEKPASQAELEKKLRTLEAAFDEGMISVKAYIEDKVRIIDELKKIRGTGNNKFK